MTVEEVKEEYGNNADTLCTFICTMCTANDEFCPSYCESCEWIQRNYDKAVERLAKLDGDVGEFMKRLKRWKE